MHLVAPDILADACGLSLGLIITTGLVGLALWLVGWWTHRFWVVLIITVLGGIYGLYEAPTFQAQPSVAAVLLAVAAGMLALALIRLLAFVAGGLTGLLLIQGLFPSLNQPLLCFVGCGLVNLFLFRVCMMGLTSLCGALLMHYAALMALHHYQAFDAVAWATDGATLLNGSCGLVALAGTMWQFWVDRWRRRRRQQDEEESRSGEVWGILTDWTGDSSRRAA